MDKDTEEQSVEDMMAHVQLLELQAKRMQKLVEQRKQERTDMEMENVRMERQLKYLAEMAKENEEVEAEYRREQAAKQPFSGRGFTLGAPSQTVDQVTQETLVRKVDPVSVDPNKPSGNIQVRRSVDIMIVDIIIIILIMIILMMQVRLADGSRVVVKLNTDHTVSHIKQEIMAR